MSKLHYATRNPFEHEDVDKTVNEIIENLDGHVYDLIFQAVCDEMNEHYVFDSSEYLTESGLELFEDEWFEFYHENHGKIIHKLLQKLKIMKKFNGMESHLIVDALNYYVAQVERDILEMEKEGKTSIFAPGFYTNVSKELIDKVKSMTKKQITN